MESRVLKKIKEQLKALFINDNTGHDIEHTIRVYKLAMKFAEKEQANQEIVGLAALLHDVDDYKLFGKENSKNLINAKKIMQENKISSEAQEQVLEIIKTIGYRKLLDGIRPKTLEGKIVSDADMCDAIGANGILRVYAYTKSHNKPFFDENIFPKENITLQNYSMCAETAVCHIFEKILRLKKLMFTQSGELEATKREQITVDFLKHLFEEEEATEWITYLNQNIDN